MNIATVTLKRLQEMNDTMTLEEMRKALNCTEKELVELISKMEEPSILENTESVDYILYPDGSKGDLNGNFAVVL